MITRFKTSLLGLTVLASVIVFAASTGRAQASDGNFGFNVTYSKASIAWNYIDASTVTITQGEWVNLKLNTIWNLSSGCWPGADAPRCTPDYTIGQANTVVKWSQDNCPAGVSCYWYSRTGPTELTTVIVPNFTYGPSIQISNTNALSPGTYPIVFKIEEYPTGCQQSGGTCIPPKTFTVNLVVQGQPPQPAISAIPTSVAFSGTAGGPAPASNNITVKNIGNGTLNWTASLSQNWCHLNTTSGALASGASTSLSVWVDAPSNTGVFSCVINFIDPNSTNGNQTVSINYSVTGSPPEVPPSGPGSPILTSINPTQATLSQVQAQMTMDVFGSQFNPVLSNNLPYYTRNADGQTTGISAVSFIPGGLRINVPANLLAGSYTLQILNGKDFVNLRSNGLTFTVVPDSPKAAIFLTPSTLNFSAVSGGQTPGSQALVIKNTGTSDMDWTASVNQAWCHVSPASGSISPGGLVTATVTVDAPSNAGNFNCGISISAPNSNNSPQVASVNYQVSQSAVAAVCGFTNTSFRYLKFENIYPKAWAAWKELEFYDIAGNKLKPAIVGGSVDWIYPSQGAYGKAAAIDGDTYTQWNGADAGWVFPFEPPINIVLDFGKMVRLGRMRFLSQNTIPRDVNIWVGNNSNDFSTLLQKVQGNSFESVWMDFNCLTGNNLLSLTPTAMNFTSKVGNLAPEGKILNIYNTGAITLTWDAVTNQPWCHIVTTSGTLVGGSMTSVLVKVDEPSNAGTFDCLVTVSSPLSISQNLNVNYTVDPATPASISLLPSNISFLSLVGDKIPAGQALTIKNTGTGNLTWYATLDQTWCHLSPSSGMVAPGSSVDVLVTVDAPSNLGSFNCSVAISGPNTTNGPQKANIKYNVTSSVAATFNLSSHSFTFNSVVNGGAPSEQRLNIGNTGKTTLDWSATASQSWCKVQPASGSLSAGAAADITLSVDAPFAAGKFSCAISLVAQNTTNSPETVNIIYGVSAVAKPIINIFPTAFPFQGVSGGATPSAQVMSLKNVGDGDLNWSSATDQAWCHLSLGSGVLTKGSSVNIWVSVDRPSNVGAFDCSLKIFDVNDPGNFQQIPVTYKVVVASISNPPRVIAANQTCGAITISWLAGRNTSQYVLYRNTSNVLPPEPYKEALAGNSYDDTEALSGTKYYYWVRSIGSTGGTQAEANAYNGVALSACAADLSPSDKNLAAINGVTQPRNDCDYNQFQGAPTEKTLKDGDVLTFDINLCNLNGMADATEVKITDRLLNLSMPTAGFGAAVDGQPLRFVDGTPQLGEYAYDSSLYELVFNIGQVTKTAAKKITYNALVKNQNANFTGCVKCQSLTAISFKKDEASPPQTIDLYTPPIFYLVNKQ